MYFPKTHFYRNITRKFFKSMSNAVTLANVYFGWYNSKFKLYVNQSKTQGLFTYILKTLKFKF